MPTYTITGSLKAQLRKKEGNQHHTPHVHVKYQNYKAVYFLDGTLDKGSLPQQQAREVREWLKENREWLEKEWNKIRREEHAKD